MENPFANCCSKCGEESKTVEERYSFGYYAGRLCRECCFTYRDHCGIDQAMGSPIDLDESPCFNPYNVDL